MLIETDLRPLGIFRSVEGSAIAATLPSTLTPDSTGESGVLGHMGYMGGLHAGGVGRIETGFRYAITLSALRRIPTDVTP